MANIPTQLLRLWRILRARQLESDTVEGRSAERYRRIGWSTLAGGSARIIGMITGLVSVPLVAGYLGAEQYGVWLTLTSMIVLLGPLDLGIGNGVTSLIAESSGRGDRRFAGRVVSTATVLLAVIAVLGALLFSMLFGTISWPEVFNIESPVAAEESGTAAAVFVALFLVGLPLSLVGRIQLGYQSEYAASLWLAAGNVAALGVVLLVIQVGAALPWLVLALAGTPLLAVLINGLVLFGWQRRWLIPKLGQFTWSIARIILRRGWLFVILQMASVVGYQSDAIIIAQVMGAEAVTQYAIPLKLFIIGPTLLSFALTPLWPAYGEAIARGDIDWVHRTFRRSLAFALVVNGSAALVLAIAAPTILRLWVGEIVTLDPLLHLALTIWLLLNAISGPIAMVLLGANIVGFQALTSVLMAIANVVFSVFLVMNIGVSGAVFGSIAAQVLCITIPSILYMRRLGFHKAHLGQRP